MADEPITETAVERRAPRWMTVTLVLSLAVNLLIAGMVVGAMLSRDSDARPERAALLRDFGRTPFIAALEVEDRRALGRAMLREAEPLRENRADLRRRFEALLAALRSDAFDRATVERLIAEQRAVASRRLELGERMLLDRLEEMTPAARRAYADRLDRSIRRSP